MAFYPYLGRPLISSLSLGQELSPEGGKGDDRRERVRVLLLLLPVCAGVGILSLAGAADQREPRADRARELGCAGVCMCERERGRLERRTRRRLFEEGESRLMASLSLSLALSGCVLRGRMCMCVCVCKRVCSKMRSAVCMYAAAQSTYKSGGMHLKFRLLRWCSVQLRFELYLWERA